MAHRERRRRLAAPHRPGVLAGDGRPRARPGRPGHRLRGHRRAALLRRQLLRLRDSALGGRGRELDAAGRGRVHRPHGRDHHLARRGRLGDCGHAGRHHGLRRHRGRAVHLDRFGGGLDKGARRRGHRRAGACRRPRDDVRHGGRRGGETGPRHPPPVRRRRVELARGRSGARHAPLAGAVGAVALESGRRLPVGRRERGRDDCAQHRRRRVLEADARRGPALRAVLVQPVAGRSSRRSRRGVFRGRAAVPLGQRGRDLLDARPRVHPRRPARPHRRCARAGHAAGGQRWWRLPEPEPGRDLGEPQHQPLPDPVLRRGLHSSARGGGLGPGGHAGQRDHRGRRRPLVAAGDGRRRRLHRARPALRPQVGRDPVAGRDRRAEALRQRRILPLPRPRHRSRRRCALHSSAGHGSL